MTLDKIKTNIIQALQESILVSISHIVKIINNMNKIQVFSMSRMTKLIRVHLETPLSGESTRAEVVPEAGKVSPGTASSIPRGIVKRTS